MNTVDPGIPLFCACVTLPFLAGVGATLIIQRRLVRLGLPWAIIPGGAMIKKLWEARHEQFVR